MQCDTSIQSDESGYVDNPRLNAAGRKLAASGGDKLSMAGCSAGRPDPNDCDLKQMALAAVKDAAALGALALFIGAACLWLPVFAGV